MEKIELASELLKNTTNIYLKKFIKEYISEIKLLEQGKCESKELIRFDNCISYIKEVYFDITGWMLFEIPIFYSHCFWNKKTKKAFDLAVWDIGKVILVYLDSRTNEQEANSIQEAIEKYYSKADILKMAS